MKKSDGKGSVDWPPVAKNEKCKERRRVRILRSGEHDEAIWMVWKKKQTKINTFTCSLFRMRHQNAIIIIAVWILCPLSKYPFQLISHLFYVQLLRDSHRLYCTYRRVDINRSDQLHAMDNSWEWNPSLTRSCIPIYLCTPYTLPCSMLYIKALL